MLRIKEIKLVITLKLLRLRSTEEYPRLNQLKVTACV